MFSVAICTSKEVCLRFKRLATEQSMTLCFLLSSTLSHSCVQATVGTASYAAASDLGSIMDVADEEQLDTRPAPEVGATDHHCAEAFLFVQLVTLISRMLLCNVRARSVSDYFALRFLPCRHCL
jgi:hypothetical protein